MSRATLVVLALYWIACMVAYPSLPERIPIHFGMDGSPNVWAARAPGWFGLPVLASLSLLLLQAIATWAHNSPILWNVPEKQRFLALTNEQRAPIMRELTRMLQVTGMYTLLVMAVVQMEIYQSASGRSDGLSILFHLIMWPGMVGLFGYAFLLNRRVKKMILSASTPSTGG